TLISLPLSEMGPSELQTNSVPSMVTLPEHSRISFDLPQTNSIFLPATTCLLRATFSFDTPPTVVFILAPTESWYARPTETVLASVTTSLDILTTFSLWAPPTFTL